MSGVDIFFICYLSLNVIITFVIMFLLKKRGASLENSEFPFVVVMFFMGIFIMILGLIYFLINKIKEKEVDKMICPSCGLEMVEYINRYDCSCGFTEYKPLTEDVTTTTTSEPISDVEYSEQTTSDLYERIRYVQMPTTSFDYAKNFYVPKPIPKFNDFVEWLKELETTEEFGYLPKAIVKLYELFEVDWNKDDENE